MADKKREKTRVLVLGDRWTDNVLMPVSKTRVEKEDELRIKSRTRKRIDTLTIPGGALLVKELIKSMSRREREEDVFSSPDTGPDALSEGFAVREGEKDGSAEACFIKKFLGYSSHRPEKKEIDLTAVVSGNTARAKELVVIDDAGCGFRDEISAWKPVIECAAKSKNLLMIYNMSAPLFDGELWQAVSNKGLLARTIVVIQADALREGGVHITKNLSWDRTITDFLRKTVVYPRYNELKKCPHILVRFGLECTAYYHFSSKTAGNSGQARMVNIYYIPGIGEGEIAERTIQNRGTVRGLESMFPALLAVRIIETWETSGKADIEHAILDSIPPATTQVIHLLESGYKRENYRLRLSHEMVFAPNPGESFEMIEIHENENIFSKNLDTWHILFHQNQMKPLLDVAQNYVLSGSDDDLAAVPVVEFGPLLTVDRHEIESFRSIRNLFREYLKNTEYKKPLSVAVFGPPGSGKSFTVESIANSVLGRELEMLEYNLSQFKSPQDIHRAFWEIRDHTVKGEVPLVFFDEFDSSYGSQPLGWLKYFLGPMQDGKYKAGEKMHPIGRAIFVFAGGTCSSLKEFSRETQNEEHTHKNDIRQFVSAKGPDFVSRLKGYIDVLGPNPFSLEDDFYIIRRAVLLRALFLRIKHIVGEGKHIRIDKDLLRTLLIIPQYKHGSRSFQAILNMSTLRGHKEYGKSSLPSSEQLNLHVDAGLFLKTLGRDLFLKTSGEEMAAVIHEKHRMRKLQGKKNDKKVAENSFKDWSETTNEFRLSSRNHAYDIPLKLLRIGCDYRPKRSSKMDGTMPVRFTEREVEVLAKMEHKRWSHERLSCGWKLGPVYDEEKKIHPCLVPWDDLTEEQKEKERDSVRDIPEILDASGFEIYRL
jgi:hypothetical protein